MLGAAIKHGFGLAPLDDSVDFLEGPALLFQSPILETYNDMPTAKAVRRWVWEQRHSRSFRREGGFVWAFRDEDDCWIIGLGSLIPPAYVDRARDMFASSYTEL